MWSSPWQSQWVIYSALPHTEGHVPQVPGASLWNPLEIALVRPLGHTGQGVNLGDKVAEGREDIWAHFEGRVAILIGFGINDSIYI